MRQMRNALRHVLLITTLLVSAHAFAADTGPVIALRAFFTSVSQKDYAIAWATLSRKSQEGIVNSVADGEHMAAPDVRKLFDTNDPSIDAGFWESFRQSSQSETFLQVAMVPGGSSNGSDGSAVITLANGGTVTMQMYREAGSWKVGWMETFFPSNKVPSQ